MTLARPDAPQSPGSVFTALDNCWVEIPSTLLPLETESDQVGLIHLPKPDPCALAACSIMIADDEPATIEAIRTHLRRDGYHAFLTADNLTTAIDTLYYERPDVVLLDILAPRVGGLSLLEHMHEKSLTPLIPVLILASGADEPTRLRALDLGATDFLAKPVQPSELRVRVRNALRMKMHQEQLAHYSLQLEFEVRARTAELVESRKEALCCLARAAEHRDQKTGQHVFRVGRYVSLVARECGFSEDQAALLEQAALLHDVGKIGIPDSILRKSGPLAGVYKLLGQRQAYLIASVRFRDRAVV